MNFLFFLYLIGLLIACSQDIKRREVDDWLNLTLFLSSTAYILIISINNPFSIAGYGFFVLILALISFGLYYGRFFAGGDAKLLFAMAPLFYTNFFLESLQNFIFFLLFLVFAGAVYGFFFIFYTAFKSRKKLVREVSLNFKKFKSLKYLGLFVLLFLLGFFYELFFLASLFFILFILLFVFATSLEKVSFIKEKKTCFLTEGDWLSSDLSIKGRTIKSRWEGLSKKEISIIQKNKRKVWIKEGIPYVPAFFIAFLLYTIRVFILETFLNYLG